MDDHRADTGKIATQQQEEIAESNENPYRDIPSPEGARTAEIAQGEQGNGKRRRRRPFHRESYSHTHFKVYKRRWFGLAQLVLLNIVVSWDWLTFAPVSSRAADYFDVSETAINWLSTGFMFAFVLVSPLTMWTLHSGGPKTSIIWSSGFLLLGNWIRYIGTRVNGGMYPVVLVGQILTGFAQPFVLAAPTRYSDLWFTESGRISATALASLANPFGGALAQLITPLLPSIPTTVLLPTILSTACTLPTLFLPAAPPTPPSYSSTLPKPPLLSPSTRSLLTSPPFYILFLTFSCYVGLFNSYSSLLNQILYPYGYSEDEAGISGAILIVVGLVCAAILSPIFDRTHKFLLGIKLLCPLVGASYLGLVWAPQTRTLEAPYVLSGVLGAASFSLLPLALEYMVEVTWPVSPEVGSTVCWAGGQLFGGVFIVVMNALKDGNGVDVKRVSEMGRGRGGGSRPEGNMYRALVFQAVVALVVLPLPLCLGVERLGLGQKEGRLRMDETGEAVGGTGDAAREQGS
ncbi:MFS general substrate transporter [Sporormia fimetaria CBS 119925]|uniref:MFS general substrate transporter n=1 Tax=Sporormia fimetaria CBS 119925 TaxID=1340428 RepID=A0A6A6VGZ6_9PLEO|nr:MFS general substrate transporter [Sporormia fimetaria CBS 119925]